MHVHLWRMQKKNQEEVCIQKKSPPSVEWRGKCSKETDRMQSLLRNMLERALFTFAAAPHPSRAFSAGGTGRLLQTEGFCLPYCALHPTNCADTQCALLTRKKNSETNLYSLKLDFGIFFLIEQTSLIYKITK